MYAPFEQSFLLSRTRWSVVSRGKAGCDPDPGRAPLIDCINKHIESELGCSVPTLKGSWSAGVEPCAADEEYGRFNKVGRNLTYSGETDVIRMVGCRPPCTFNEYAASPRHQLQRGSKPILENQKANSLLLHFWFRSGRYLEKREYVVYDINSFIADIGRYLGLLLGHSIYSILCSFDGIWSHTQCLKSMQK